MDDWKFAQQKATQKLALLHNFSIEAHGIEFLVTVKEFATPELQQMKFMALADKQTNQKSVPFTPCGFGNTLLAALSECVKAIERFPYEGD